MLAGAIALPMTALAADYTIMAPAGPGGGWDQTARALQDAMTTTGISGNVQVINVPGARRHDRAGAVRPGGKR